MLIDVSNGFIKIQVFLMWNLFKGRVNILDKVTKKETG